MTDPFAVQAGPVDYGTWEFKAVRHILLDLCEHAAAAVSAREAQRPDLACFQVRCGGPDIYLQVAATDTEQAVIARTEAVSYKGQLDQAYIPARWLLSILKEVSGGDVTVSVAKNMAGVSGGGASWTIQLPDSTAYPELTAPHSLDFKTYQRDKLLAALHSVRHAVCRDGSLANLTQVQISRIATPDESDSMAWVTASDGNRLARAELPGFPEAFCIPAPALDDLMKLLAMKGAEVGVAQTPKLVAFRVGHVVYTATKRMLPFPDVDSQLLKKAQANDEKLSVDAVKLRAAVRRVRIAADAGTSAMALALSPSSATLTAKDEGGSALEDVPATWTGTPGRLVVVSHVALSEALAAHPEPVCEFRLGKDIGKKLSTVYLSGGGVTQVLTQLPAALVGLLWQPVRSRGRCTPRATASSSLMTAARTCSSMSGPWPRGTSPICCPGSGSPTRSSAGERARRPPTSGS